LSDEREVEAQPVMPRRTLVAIVVMASAAVAAWVGSEAAAGRGPLADPLGARCTLGYAGAQATVTITGFGAREACEASLSGDAPFYIEELEPSGALVCRYPTGRLVYTVRDVGMALVGSSLCDSVAALVGAQ
jgi:hypothetical protein